MRPSDEIQLPWGVVGTPWVERPFIEMAHVVSDVVHPVRHPHLEAAAVAEHTSDLENEVLIVRQVLEQSKGLNLVNRSVSGDLSEAAGNVEIGNPVHSGPCPDIHVDPAMDRVPAAAQVQPDHVGHSSVRLLRVTSFLYRDFSALISGVR